MSDVFENIDYLMFGETTLELNYNNKKHSSIYNDVEDIVKNNDWLEDSVNTYKLLMDDMYKVVIIKDIDNDYHNKIVINRRV